MVNVSMRWWGHRYLYDGEELERRNARGRLAAIRRCSLWRELGRRTDRLETRPDSMLILEAVRP